MTVRARDNHAALLEPIEVRNMFVSLTNDQQRELIGLAKGILMGVVISAKERSSSSTSGLHAEGESIAPTNP